MDLLACILFMAMALVALYGYGQPVALRLLGHGLPVGTAATLGLAIVLALGGLLNLAGLATGLFLDALFIGGFIAGCLAWRHQRATASPVEKKELVIYGLWGLMVIGLGWLFAAPEAFNFHDDYEKYLAHPARMLATGTLGGSSFNALGTQTLGGQAFLHGFVLEHFNLRWINSVDSVFAAGLCLLMLAGQWKRSGWSPLATCLAMLLLVAIAPQYVNTSSTYTGAALILLLVLLPLNLAAGPQPGQQQTQAKLPHWAALPVLYALIYSGLLALKSSFLLVVVCHFFFLAVTGLLLHRITIKELMLLGTTSLAFFLPWMIIHLEPRWETIVNNASISTGDQPLALIHISSLFKTYGLAYGFGSSILHYTLVMMTAAAACTFFATKPQQQFDRFLLASIAFLLPATYLIALIVVAPRLLGLEHGLRYQLPVIIALAPTGFAMVTAFKANKPQLTRLSNLVIVLLLCGCIGLFYPSAVKRIEHQARFGNNLSFTGLSSNPTFLKFQEMSLETRPDQPIVVAQQSIPEGAGILAWSIYNFQLDFSRNRILDVDPAGLTTPWLDFPFGGNPDQTLGYLRRRGIEYILWQHSGYGVRDLGHIEGLKHKPHPNDRLTGTRTRQFLDFLNELRRFQPVLFSNAAFIVYCVSETSACTGTQNPRQRHHRQPPADIE